MRQLPAWRLDQRIIVFVLAGGLMGAACQSGNGDGARKNGGAGGGPPGAGGAAGSAGGTGGAASGGTGGGAGRGGAGGGGAGAGGTAGTGGSAGSGGRADGGTADGGSSAVPAHVLPVLMIDVPNKTPEMFKLYEPKDTARIRVIENHDGTHKDLTSRAPAVDSTIGISLRGNSSTRLDGKYMFLQRSYSIELRDENGKEKPLPFLGMPAEADFALIGCWNDKTCMRHALAYAMGREFGRWNPRTRFVELFFNGTYLGLYLVVEPPRRGESRIPIAKVAPDMTMGDITGGYIFRREGPGKKSATAAPPVMDWLSKEGSPDRYGNQLVYTYHYPKEDVITDAQKTYLQNYMAGFEAMMKSPEWASPTAGYPAKIDLNSWIDYALMNEVSHNIDAYWKSVWYFKDSDARGGKLVISPLWDYNMGFGNADYRDGWRTDKRNFVAQQEYGGECDYQGRFMKGPPVCDVGCCPAVRTDCDATTKRCWNIPLIPFYWEKLWQHGPFLAAMKCRWQELRKGPLGMTFVDARLEEWKKQLLPLAVPRHLGKWPQLLKYTWANPYVVDPSSAPVEGESPEKFFEREVSWLRGWLDKRLRYLDANLPGTCGS